MLIDLDAHRRAANTASKVNDRRAKHSNELLRAAAQPDDRFITKKTGLQTEIRLEGFPAFTAFVIRMPNGQYRAYVRRNPDVYRRSITAAPSNTAKEAVADAKRELLSKRDNAFNSRRNPA